jgi:mono/diheme cytochrome c family protein
METENPTPPPSNAKMFGIIIIVLIVILVIIFGVDFGGGSTNTKTPITGTEQTDAPTVAGNKWKEGKDLFKSNCAACHNPKADGTGPALLGAKARWIAAGEHQGKTGEQWLHAWVKNYNEPVEAGYKYAVDMANSRPSAMNSFPYLKDEEIDQIFTYIDSSFAAK